MMRDELNICTEHPAIRTDGPGGNCVAWCDACRLPMRVLSAQHASHGDLNGGRTRITRFMFKCEQCGMVGSRQFRWTPDLESKSVFERDWQKSMFL